ncbi:MAG: hypothetical protein DRJ64_08980 [Thermoprotei archaeon]|nr:MAG: hypothetical protein DRJ64_08980 [Thermoprotei archaeon]
MVVIETDVLIACASETDRHHDESVALIRNTRNIKLSPYALVELDLLISSRVLVVKISDFYNALSDMVEYYDIKLLAPHPLHFLKAFKLREKYGLTFFDSLHAASAICENDILVSYDKIYATVDELDYRHPTIFNNP